MSIRYQISTWRSSTAAEARDYSTRQRIDAALTETWRQIYDMCAADGALDTERAHRLLREFKAFEKETTLTGTRTLFGHYFSRDFVLRSDNAGACEHVRFVAIRND
jgi:hypothetical protein